MDQVFVSYARADRERVAPYVEALEREGLTVFWDPEIPLGVTWDEFLSKKLEEASCVLVFWTQRSADSEWVRAEATEGAQRGCLVPVLLEHCTLPLYFRRFQTAILPPDWALVVQAVKALCPPTHPMI